MNLLMKTVSGMLLFFLSVNTLTLAFNIQPVKAKSIPIGEWFTDGRIAICVHSFKTAQELIYYPYAPKTMGYIFAWVDLSLKNVGKTIVKTNPLYAYLKDYENYLYKSTTVLSPKAFRLMNLPPGETIKGEIYWEIPSTAVIIAFIWHDPYSYIVIPEFRLDLVLPLFMLLTLLVAVFLRKRSQRIT